MIRHLWLELTEVGRLQSFLALARQDFLRFRRGRAFIVVVFLFPVLLWGFQLGMTYLDYSDQATTYEGQLIYVINQDSGSPEYNLGDIFVATFGQSLENNNSQIYHAVIEELDDNPTDFVEFVRTEGLTPLVVIPENFTETYIAFSDNDSPRPNVFVYTLPKDERFGDLVYYQARSILQQSPFSEYDVNQFTGTRSSTIYYDVDVDEDAVDFGFVFGIVFFATYIAAFVPSAYVSSTIVGEREKNTLDALLTLPIRRMDILLAKFVGGVGVIGIFTVINGIIMVAFPSIQSYVFNDDLKVNFTAGMIFIMVLSTFMTAVLGLGLGIAVTARMKEKRVAEQTYSFAIVIPVAVIALIFLFAEVEGLSPLYIIPWTHSFAILLKGLFPQTVGNNFITSSMTLDIVFHVVALILFIFLTLLLSSKVFDEEGSIFKLRRNGNE